MLQCAGLCFAITLIASAAGFGGFLEAAPAASKAVAVVFLLLFFMSLFRLLAAGDPPSGLLPSSDPGSAKP